MKLWFSNFLTEVIEVIKERLATDYIDSHYAKMGDKDLKIILKGDIGKSKFMQ